MCQNLIKRTHFYWPCPLQISYAKYFLRRFCFFRRNYLQHIVGKIVRYQLLRVVAYCLFNSTHNLRKEQPLWVRKRAWKTHVYCITENQKFLIWNATVLVCILQRYAFLKYRSMFYWLPHRFVIPLGTYTWIKNSWNILPPSYKALMKYTLLTKAKGILVGILNRHFSLWVHVYD